MYNTTALLIIGLLVLKNTIQTFLKGLPPGDIQIAWFFCPEMPFTREKFTSVNAEGLSAEAPSGAKVEHLNNLDGNLTPDLLW